MELDYIDRTVRAVPCESGQEGSAHMSTYNGRDYCSLAGAVALVKKLKAYWAARDEYRAFEIYPAIRAYDSNGGSVYGIRAYRPPPPVAAPEVVREPRPLAPAEIGLAPRARIKSVIRQTLQSFHHEVTYADLMKGGVTSELIAARKGCVRAVAVAFPNFSEHHLGRVFSIDQATVRRILHEHVRAYRIEADRLRTRQLRRALAVARSKQLVAA